MVSSSENFRIVDREYGKSWVKMLHVKREGLVHSIREYEVDTKLTLDSEKDYIDGDNRDIIATDTQKNTVYLLAKKHGVGSPEQFAVLLAKHFISEYPWVNRARVRVEAHPWQRIKVDGREHNHAFVSTPVADRYAQVCLKRYREPEIIAGLKNLRVLKTTQSGFVDFVSDGYRSLPDQEDRIFSTIVETSWKYKSVSGLCFDKAFDNVKKLIFEFFAGCPRRGLFSPSVQQTLYLIEKAALESIPQMEWMSMAMPNKHYFNVDLSKFPRSVGGTGGAKCTNDEVFMPVDKPSGMIIAKLARNEIGSKL